MVHIKEPINALVQGELHRPPHYCSGLESFKDNLRSQEGIVCVLTTSCAKWFKPEIFRLVTVGVEFSTTDGGLGCALAKLIWSTELAKAGVQLTDEEISTLAKGAEGKQASQVR